MKNDIGKTIKLLRTRANLTQNELAKKIGITDKAVSKWERGLSYPDITYISKLAVILDVDSDALFIEENKHMSTTWGGILYIPESKKGISLKTKLNSKSLFDLLISYFLLVNIKDIIIVCDERDISFINKSKKKICDYGIWIEVVSYKEYLLKEKFAVFQNNSNIMLIHGLFFIYGVGLTSTFQRAMMDSSKTLTFDNPKIPIIYGSKTDIINIIKNNHFNKKYETYKMFRGYIKIDLNSKKNIKKCSDLIAELESIGNIDIYNPIEIIKNREL